MRLRRRLQRHQRRLERLRRLAATTDSTAATTAAASPAATSGHRRRLQRRHQRRLQAGIRAQRLHRQHQRRLQACIAAQRLLHRRWLLWATATATRDSSTAACRLRQFRFVHRTLLISAREPAPVLPHFAGFLHTGLSGFRCVLHRQCKLLPLHTVAGAT